MNCFMEKYMEKKYNFVFKSEIFLYIDGYFVVIFKFMNDRNEVYIRDYI